MLELFLSDNRMLAMPILVCIVDWLISITNSAHVPLCGVISTLTFQCWCLCALQAIANEITTGHNEALAELIPMFAADHLEASVILFNFEAFLIDLAANASALGITDTTTPCYTGAVAGTAATAANTSAVCSNPNTHAYWDSVHPTGIVHQLWGQAIAEQLMPLFTTSASGRKLLSDDHAGIASGAISVYGQPL